MSDTARAPLERALGRILWELRPYMQDVVVIGGWVPYLYQRYGSFPLWRARLSLTAEVDVMLAHDLTPGDRKPLAEILRAAGYQPVNESDPAAVWASDPESGEKIEFLVPHRGTALTQGGIAPINAQPAIAAISLPSLEILHQHTGALSVEARGPANGVMLVAVTVPRLGAYTINKAATYNDRTPLAGGTANPKLAKDLLYLRDLMAAGDDVVTTIEHDIHEMIGRDEHVHPVVRKAGNNLVGTTSVGRHKLEEAGAMLAEREGTSIKAATADVTGHLTDLAELLTAFGV